MGSQARRDEYSTEYKLQKTQISFKTAAEGYIAVKKAVKAYNTKTVAAQRKDNNFINIDLYIRSI